MERAVVPGDPAHAGHPDPVHGDVEGGAGRYPQGRRHARAVALLRPGRGVSTLGIFLLGFFTDVERISFHWPLPGYLALLVAVPVVLNGWPRWLRRTGWWLAGAGMVLAFGYYLMASTPALREQLAGSKYYPRNFAGWQPLAMAVREELQQMPAGTRVLAGNFKVGAELGFQLGNGDIEVLPHPLNDKHGRTAQLAQWELLHEGKRSTPMLLVLSPSDQRYRDLLARYHAICGQVGPLPAPRVVSSDHGFQRFLLFRLPAQRARGVRDSGNGVAGYAFQRRKGVWHAGDQGMGVQGWCRPGTG